MTSGWLYILTSGINLVSIFFLSLIIKTPTIFSKFGPELVSIFLKIIWLFSKLNPSPTFRFAIISFEKIAFKIILNIRRLNPKCETVCEKFL